MLSGISLVCEFGHGLWLGQLTIKKFFAILLEPTFSTLFASSARDTLSQLLSAWDAAH